MSAININKNNFKHEVMDSDKPVLLDFWASWCAPCRMVIPIIEEIASERTDIKVGKINVDEQPELASQLYLMMLMRRQKENIFFRYNRRTKFERGTKYWQKEWQVSIKKDVFPAAYVKILVRWQRLKFTMDAMQ